MTVGTVFHSAHIKLHQWLQAAYLLASSKKGCSSNQMARALGVTVKTGWFVTHRLREAMAERGMLPPMGGDGAIVEIDETFYGKKAGAPVRRGYGHKHAILSLWLSEAPLAPRFAPSMSEAPPPPICCRSSKPT